MTTKDKTLDELSYNIEIEEKSLIDVLPKNQLDEYNKLCTKLTNYNLMEHEDIRKVLYIWKLWIDMEQVIVDKFKIINSLIREVKLKLEKDGKQ